MTAYVDAQDNFDRLLSQTKALVLMITANDNFMSIDKREVANALWLVMDRLDDIGEAFPKTGAQ